MISIEYKTGDPYRLHGIRHFTQKEGLPIGGQGGCPVGIAYGDVKAASKYTIRVVENDIQVGRAGWLEYNGMRSPLYELPRELEGTVLASFSGESTYPCVVESDDGITIGFDLFNEIGRILCGHLEGVGESPDEKRERAQIPVADFYEKILFDCVLQACGSIGLPLVRKAFWPGGRKFAVCLTHDVDELSKTYRHVTVPARHLMRGNLVGAVRQLLHSAADLLGGRNPYWTFDDIMKLEGELGVKSSFYFLEEKGRVSILSPKTWILSGRRYSLNNPPVKAMIKKLAGGGWDVGVHGSYDSFQDEGLFSAEKDRLEGIIGGIHGTRQHHLNLCFPKTWRIHESCGLEYDTSLGFKDTCGFRWGTCFPFHPLDCGELKPLNLLEIPLTIMDTPLFSHKGDVSRECAGLMDKVQNYGGVLTLLWHHSVFNRSEFPGFTQTYSSIIESALQRDAWVTHACHIAGWWSRRQKAELKASIQGGQLTVECPAEEGLMLEIYNPDGKVHTIKPEGGRITLSS
jgi:hypothetical protein